MNRALSLVLVAIAGALAACNGDEAPAQTVQLSRPSSVAAFHGVVFGGSVTKPYPAYLAIANEARDDISILNAGDDTPVLAPVSTNTFVVPVLRPAILVSAPLGVEGADLLVAVSAGDSRLQLVRTWPVDGSAKNEIVEEVDFGDDILAAIALPARSGPSGEPTARVAVALAGGSIGVATYVRSGDVIANAAPVDVSAPFGFQPIALAAVADDPTHVYAATRDPIPATGGVLGVAEIEVVGAQPADPPTFAVRALDARGPTRLVAAAKLHERSAGSSAKDGTAFDLMGDPVDRVYAVLDESACGMSERIDCGVAVLDPVSGKLLADVVPDGVPGRMPYLAPIQLPSRPVAIAVSLAPKNGPSGAYTGDLMRLWPASGELATTAVAAVPCEDGRIYFLDLARWKVANELNPLASLDGTATSTAVEARSAAGVILGTVRLWVADTSGLPLSATATADEVRAQIGVTPGYTRSETFTVGYQAELPSLSGRKTTVGPSSLWLAMTGTSGQPIRLSDPALGVRSGDIVTVNVSGLPADVASGCAGTDPPGAATGTSKVFEARVAAVVTPAEYPDGALQLEPETADPVPAPADAPGAGEAVASWAACLNALATHVSSGITVPGLTASIRAGGYVVSSDLAGHLGRPVPGDTGFTLEYPSSFDEDALSGEALVLARKARRSYHLAESCTDTDGTCEGRWPGGTPWLTNPDVAGPVVSFRFALQTTGSAPAEARRGLGLRISTSSGVAPYAAGSATDQGALVEARGAAVFDRSELDASKGYRFLVPYSANFVIDTSPSIAGSDPVAIH